LLRKAASGCTEFVVSLRRCDRYDSHGLAMLFAFARQMGAHCIIATDSHVKGLLETSGFDEVVATTPSVTHAIEMFLTA
jgi:anti-anti-sigma regulatory factor